MSSDVRLIPDAEVATWKPKPDLVKGLLAAKEVNMLFAPKNRGKTFLGLDLAYSIAVGLPTWLDQSINDYGSVVYLCAEGRNGLPNRRAAWLQTRVDGYDGAIPTISFVDGVTDIRKHEQVVALADQIREHHPDVVLVVIDTLSQHMPGGDEGTADMSAALHECQFLRDQLDTTVLALHHPTKANEDNERGGSGFRGGCADVLNIAERHGVFTLQSQNARDRSKDLTVKYVLDVVTLAGLQFRDAEGKQFTSCVPKVVGAATEAVQQQRAEAEIDRAVLGKLLPTIPQSAAKIQKAVGRQGKAVRDSLARLKGRSEADQLKRGWIKLAA